MAEPTVRMSGIVFSSLMFHHVNSGSDVEGLILGESKVEEQVTISDSQADHIHIEEIYNIQKHIACHKLNSFYDSVGEVNLDTLKNMLADNKQDSVIGWYRQRRNSDQLMTFRERLVHERLQSALSNPHLVFLLLTPSTLSAPGSTHRTEYAAFISRSRRLVKVPVLVNNLGLLEQLSYWKMSAPCSAAGYNLTVKRHGSRFFSSNGFLRDVNDMNKMNDSLQAELQKTCGDVEESERLVETLQADVSSLRKRVADERKKMMKRKEEDEDAAPVQQQNVRLREAVRALFSCSPLLHSQTLTLQAFPVPDHSVTTTTIGSVTMTTDQEINSALHPGSTNIRKRLKAAAALRDRKRRKSRS